MIMNKLGLVQRNNCYVGDTWIDHNGAYLLNYNLNILSNVQAKSGIRKYLDNDPMI